MKAVRFKFEKKPSLTITSNFSKLVRINHPNNCADVDLIEIAERTSGLSLVEFNQIHFDLADIAGVTVEVKLEDRGSSLSRAFKYNKFRSSGPAIKFDSLSQSAIRCNLYILTAWGGMEGEGVVQTNIF